MEDLDLNDESFFLDLNNNNDSKGKKGDQKKGSRGEKTDSSSSQTDDESSESESSEDGDATRKAENGGAGVSKLPTKEALKAGLTPN